MLKTFTLPSKNVSPIKSVNTVDDLVTQFSKETDLFAPRDVRGK